ncbi:MAG: phage major capsid protein [Clostridia bacterium]|nr:phage major capsid protein [Clostridia bacterium]
MSIEEIKNISAEECEARIAEIRSEMNAEDADLEALSAEVDAIEERKSLLIKAEEERKALSAKVANEQTATVIEERKEIKKMENIEIRNTPEYIDAFAEYIKSEDDKECRSLLTENVSGDVAVPELVYDIVKTAWENEEIMSLVRHTYIKGNLKVGFEISGDPAIVHTEGGDPVTEEELVLGTVTLVPASIKKWISVSDEVMDMRGEAFLRYIYDELTHRIAKKAADVLVGIIAASPTTSTSTAPAVPAIDVAAIAIDTIAQAIGNLSDEATNPVIVMNKLTWSAFKAVQYAGGFNVDPFEGLKVVFNDSLKSFTSASDGEVFAIVGDFGQGAIANFPNGDDIRIKFDENSLAEADLVKIIGRKYVALGVVAPNAFVNLKKDV